MWSQDRENTHHVDLVFRVLHVLPQLIDIFRFLESHDASTGWVIRTEAKYAKKVEGATTTFIKQRVRPAFLAFCIGEGAQLYNRFEFRTLLALRCQTMARPI